MEGFKLNLYHDEIYIFTPKGDMKTLPAGATPIDFAYAIHTEIGNGCIGAKVNGKIVRLNSELHSGDRVEIITSKNQKPKADWLKFVVTHRARLKIRSAINEERRQQIEKGRNIWDKMLSGTKKLLSDNDIVRQARKYGIKTPADFFSALANHQIDGEKVLQSFTEEQRQQLPEISPAEEVAQYDDFAEKARKVPEETDKGRKRDEVIIQGLPNIAYAYAKCCKPVPGDDIIGFVTKEGVVKIHRKNCVNVTNESLLKSERVVSVSWNRKVETQFLAGIKVIGEDRIGITNQITGVISKSDINIRSLSLNARDGMFIATVMVYIRNISKLQSLMDKIRKVQGIFSVERLSN